MQCLCNLRSGLGVLGLGSLDIYCISGFAHVCLRLTAHSVLLRCVHMVVGLRRFETLTLHQLVQGLATSGCPWLQLPPVGNRRHGPHAAQGQGRQVRGAAVLPCGPSPHPSRLRLPLPGLHPNQGGIPRAVLPHQQGTLGHSTRSTGPGWAQRAQHAQHGPGPTPLHVHRQRVALLHAWVWWLFAELVLPLLRSHFYVTETEPYRHHVFYYRWVAEALQAPCVLI